MKLELSIPVLQLISSFVRKTRVIDTGITINIKFCAEN